MDQALKPLNFPSFSPRIKNSDDRREIFDPIRRKYLKLTPEEWVRQSCINYLTRHKNYPASLLAIEKGIRFNQVALRYDIVAYSRKKTPLLLVECKAPDVAITQKAFDQIAVYNLKLEVPFLLVTNGLQHFCCMIDPENSRYLFLKEVPEYGKAIEEF